MKTESHDLYDVIAARKARLRELYDLTAARKTRSCEFYDLPAAQKIRLRVLYHEKLSAPWTLDCYEFRANFKY